MKNENGVTLISLIIYVILITLVVAGVSAITASLYGNVNMYKEDLEGSTLVNYELVKGQHILMQNE